MDSLTVAFFVTLQTGHGETRLRFTFCSADAAKPLAVLCLAKSALRYGMKKMRISRIMI